MTFRVHASSTMRRGYLFLWRGERVAIVGRHDDVPIRVTLHPEDYKRLKEGMEAYERRQRIVEQLLQQAPPPKEEPT